MVGWLFVCAFFLRKKTWNIKLTLRKIDVNYDKNTMQRLPEDTENQLVSFDLADFFDGKNLEMSELDAEDIPDNILSEIILDPTLQNTEKFETSDTNSPHGKLLKPRSRSNENRFKAVDDKQIDTIAGKTCKKTTHKQTDWGVKVLKGE